MYFKVFDRNGNDITKDEYGRSRTVFDEEEKKYTICAKHFYKEAIKEFAERLKEN